MRENKISPLGGGRMKKALVRKWEKNGMRFVQVNEKIYVLVDDVVDDLENIREILMIKPGEGE